MGIDFNHDKQVKLKCHACCILNSSISNGHLSLKHSKMELMLIIGANGKKLNDIVRSEIEIYLEKRRKIKISDTEPQNKVVYYYYYY